MRKLLLWCSISLLAFNIHGQQHNGFHLEDALIPAKDILRGGPPRDGIPSIDQPVFSSAEEFVEYPDVIDVLGVYYNGVAKAYPIKIMDWHEVVNDEFDGKPVVITYCPLCGSGIAFEADIIKGKPSKFGVSGLLYNSDVLLYDRSTESLWSQIMGEAISGPLKGKDLQPIRTYRITLGAWKNLYPRTLILTTQTGFNRNYQATPYGNYDQENSTYFPVTYSNSTFHKKEWVIGIEINGVYKAYSIKRLSKLPQQQLVDEVGGESLMISWDDKAENVRITRASGEELLAVQMFWFAWAAFHPDTEIFD